MQTYLDKSVKKLLWIIAVLAVGIVLAVVALVCVPAHAQWGQRRRGVREESRSLYWPVCTAAAQGSQDGLGCVLSLSDEPVLYHAPQDFRERFWQGVVPPTSGELEERIRASACLPLNDGQRVRFEEAQALLLRFFPHASPDELPEEMLLKGWFPMTIEVLEAGVPYFYWSESICVLENDVGESQHAMFDPLLRQIQIPPKVFERDVYSVAAALLHGATHVAYYENWHHLLGGNGRDAIHVATGCADVRWVFDHTIEAVALINERLWSLENRVTEDPAELDLWLGAFEAVTGDQERLHALVREGLLLNQGQRHSGASADTVCGPVPPTGDWRDVAFVTPIEASGNCQFPREFNTLLRDILLLSTIR